MGHGLDGSDPVKHQVDLQVAMIAWNENGAKAGERLGIASKDGPDREGVTHVGGCDGVLAKGIGENVVCVIVSCPDARHGG